MLLTPQQQYAMQIIREFFSDSRSSVFILRGYAGTGKTTMIAAIVEYLHSLSYDVTLMAPTGRAAKVLRAKMPNCNATTIHRTIYSFDKVFCNEMTDAVKYIFPLREDNDEKKSGDAPATIKQNPIFIVDEASMLSSSGQGNVMFQYGSGFLMDDLIARSRLRYGGKVVFVGDPMQLPPVGEDASLALDANYFRTLGLKTMEFELTDVLRQEMDSTILANAMLCRRAFADPTLGRPSFSLKEDEVMEVNANDVASLYCSLPLGSAAVICRSNKQAAVYNAAIRDRLFPHAKSVSVGDRLMVVSNNYLYNEDVMNGDLITVLSIDGAVETIIQRVWSNVDGVGEYIDVRLAFRRITFLTDDGRQLSRNIIESLLESDGPSLSIDEKKALFLSMRSRVRDYTGIDDPKSPYYIEAVMADEYYNALQVKYGYAFTCHKAQGGEWENLFVDFSGRGGADTLRWNYTAITRAVSRLWLVSGDMTDPMANLIIHPVRKMSNSRKDLLALSDYLPPTRSLRLLRDLLSRLCSENDVEIRGVVEGQYRVTYYLATSGKRSNIAFTFDKSGNISTATPASDILDEDERLLTLVDALMDYVMDNCL